MKLTERLTDQELNKNKYEIKESDIEMTIYCDINENKELIEKEICNLKSCIERREKLLSNPGYVNKAPENLVNEEKTKLKLEKIKLEELINKCK